MRRCTTHALYRSKLWQQDLCQNPQNTNPDGSTLEGGGAEEHHQEDPYQKVLAIIDETPQRPIQQIARDLGVSHTTVNACEGRFEV